MSIISSQEFSAIPALFTAMKYYLLFNSLIELTAKRESGTKEKGRSSIWCASITR